MQNLLCISYLPIISHGQGLSSIADNMSRAILGFQDLNAWAGGELPSTRNSELGLDFDSRHPSLEELQSTGCCKEGKEGPSRLRSIPRVVEGFHPAHTTTNIPNGSIESTVLLMR